MKPLEITDKDGDYLKLTSQPKVKCDYIFIETKNEIVQIHKESAIQIINHLKQCFEL